MQKYSSRTIICKNILPGHLFAKISSQDKIIDWKLGTVGHNPTATQYLIFHKFGKELVQVKKEKKELSVQKVLGDWLKIAGVGQAESFGGIQREAAQGYQPTVS